MDESPLSSTQPCNSCCLYLINAQYEGARIGKQKHGAGMGGGVVRPLSDINADGDVKCLFKNITIVIVLRK